MKNKNIIGGIIGIIMTAGITIFNYTDNDVILESGQVIEHTTMPKHFSKAFKKRDLKKGLYITLHHTAGNKNQTVESIAKDQIARGFAEFAYHFAIYQDGTIYAVNDIEEVSWHDSGQNTNSIGIVLVGNYQNDKLTEEQLKSIKLLTTAICNEVKIIGIRGHRDTSPTLCPGDNAYFELKEDGIFF